MTSNSLLDFSISPLSLSWLFKLRVILSNKTALSLNSRSLKKESKLTKSVLKVKSIKYFFVPSTNNGSFSKSAWLKLLLDCVSLLFSSAMITSWGAINKNSILFFLPNFPNSAIKVSKFDLPVISSIIFAFSLFNLSNLSLIILYWAFKLSNSFFFFN